MALTYTHPAWADRPPLMISLPLRTIDRAELDRRGAFRDVRRSPPRYTVGHTEVDRDTFVAAWVAAGRDASEVP